MISRNPRSNLIKKIDSHLNLMINFNFEKKIISLSEGYSRIRFAIINYIISSIFFNMIAERLPDIDDIYEYQ